MTVADFRSPELVQHEGSVPALARHTLINVERLLRRSMRDPLTLMQALLYPAALLVILNLVLGRQVSAFAQYNALYGTVPMVCLVAIMASSTAAVVSLGRERDGRLLARMWVLPIHRNAGLIARVIAEVLRMLAAAVVIVVVGYVLGFRFTEGIAAAVGFVGVPVLFGVGYFTMIAAVSLWLPRMAVLEMTSLATSLLMFFSTGFVPLAAFPEWVQPFVEYQPLTCAIDAMRGLSLGGAVQAPLANSVIWSVGAVVIFAAPAAVGYRRASK